MPIRVDCLNGDKYETGKVAPDGSPDPSIFSTEGNPVGIQVGTAIATLVRKADHTPSRRGRFSSIYGDKTKRTELIETAEVEPSELYESIIPDAADSACHSCHTVQSSERLVRLANSTLSDLFPVWFPASSELNVIRFPYRHQISNGSGRVSPITSTYKLEPR